MPCTTNLARCPSASAATWRI